MGRKPFSFLSPRRTEEREGSSAPASIPALWGMVAARDEGKRERGLRGFDSPSYLGLGWSGEVGPRGPAAAALGGSGGGIRGPGRRRAVVAWDVELEGDAVALL